MRNRHAEFIGTPLTHGHSVNGITTPTYQSWQSMRRRCRDPKEMSWKYYGAKGIKVCERWSKFENFLEDMGERPQGMTIDRIDSSKDYEPSNCRWADCHTQHLNKSHPLKLHCHKGHPFNEEHTYVSPKGRRHCRTCNRDKARFRAKQALAEGEGI